MKKLLRELVLLVFVATPFIYLAAIWSKLPERVPTKFNGDGNPIDWSNKSTLPVITASILVGIYLLMFLIGRIAGKEKVGVFAEKNYYYVRLTLEIFLSIIMTYCLHLSYAGKM